MKRNGHSDDRLPVEKIIRDFEREEQTGRHRKDAFKIAVTFDEALGRILKAKPEHKHKNR